MSSDPNMKGFTNFRGSQNPPLLYSVMAKHGQQICIIHCLSSLSKTDRLYLRFGHIIILPLILKVTKFHYSLNRANFQALNGLMNLLICHAFQSTNAGEIADSMTNVHWLRQVCPRDQNPQLQEAVPFQPMKNHFRWGMSIVRHVEAQKSFPEWTLVSNQCRTRSMKTTGRQNSLFSFEENNEAHFVSTWGDWKSGHYPPYP